MTKVLWFSRHSMSVEQYVALKTAFPVLHVTQLSGDAQNVHVSFEGKQPEVGAVIADTILLGLQEPLKNLVQEFDEVAAVLPIGMQHQILPFLPAGRLLVAKNGRELDDYGKVQFVFQKWEAISRIEIIMQDL